MDKKFVSRALGSTSNPLMLFLPRGETAGKKKFKLLAFSSPLNGYKLLTNLPAAKDMVTADTELELLPTPEQTLSIDEVIEDEDTVEMQSSDGDTVYTDAALAFDLDGQSIISPRTGKKIRLAYASDEEVDAGLVDEVDTGEGEEEEVVDEVDDSALEEPEDDGETLDEPEEDSTEESEDEVVDDSGEDSGDEELVEDDESEVASQHRRKALRTAFKALAKRAIENASLEEEEESDGEEEDNFAEDEVMEDDAPVDDETEVEISAIEFADDSKPLRLVALTDNNDEVAVFLGTSHVGTMVRINASESASTLFKQGSKLLAAFKPAFEAAKKQGAFDTLGSFGYAPVVYDTNLGKVAMRHIQKSIATATKTETAKTTNIVERRKQTTALAMLGLSKGIFDKKLPLITDLATILERAGVADAETVVRKALANSAQALTKAIFEQAEELEVKSDEYLTGLADTVKKADFTSASKATPKLNLVSTQIPVHREQASVRFNSAQGSKPTTIRPDLFKGFGTRR